MTALNISYTPDEMDLLRERAREEGKSLRTLIHDESVAAIRRKTEQEMIQDAFHRAMSASEGLLARLRDK